ncbi:MAG: hypothetical protein PHX22_11875 [Dysgonamonadaceae bacterium]|nr:hypothetical protein [Dysgonamonadaceae bacterium]
MIEKLFNLIFDPSERTLIRSRCRAEPWITARKAWMLFAYMNNYSTRDIGWCTNRNNRQARYLIEKAEELYSVNDRDLHNFIREYETKVVNASGINSKADR